MIATNINMNAERAKDFELAVIYMRKHGINAIHYVVSCTKENPKHITKANINPLWISIVKKVFGIDFSDIDIPEAELIIRKSKKICSLIDDEIRNFKSQLS